MAILTFDELSRIQTRQSKSYLLREAQQFSLRKRLFLSHSSQDQAILPDVVAFFEQFEAEVYVDVRDERMPNPPSPETGKILKGRIDGCPRFVVLLTEQSRNSKWVPWEIGFADSCKGLLNIALLVVGARPDEPVWLRQEYLGLYPVIRKTTTVNDPQMGWYVENPENRNRVWPLKTWLHMP